MSEPVIPERKHKTWPAQQDELMTCGHHLCLASEVHIGSGVVCDLCAAEAQLAQMREALWSARKMIVEKIHDGSEFDTILQIDKLLAEYREASSKIGEK